MTALVRATTAGTLGVLAGFHVAWGRGSSFPFRDVDELTDAVAGRRTLPPPGACFAVAGALTVAAAFVADFPRRAVPRRVQRVGVTGVAVVLATRGALGLVGRTDVVVAGQCLGALPPPRPPVLLAAVRRARRRRAELAPSMTVDASDGRRPRPTSPPEWLTAALAERHPGVEVDTVEVLEQNEVTNAHARLRVTYVHGDDAPETMFCKLPPNDDRRAQIIATGMGHREARFYAELAPSIAMRVPDAHVARTDDGRPLRPPPRGSRDHGLRTSPTAPGGSRSTPPPARSKTSRRCTSASTIRPAAPPRHPWVHVSRPTSDYAAGMLREGIDHHRDRLTDSFVDIAEIYIAHHDELQRLWHEGPHTVIHGDTHIGNLFLDEGRVGFLDWGIINVNTPMRDISYLLTMAMSIDDRRAHERDLLRFYLDLRARRASPRSRSTRRGAHIASTPRTTSPLPARWCASPRTSRSHDGSSPITSSSVRRPRSTTSRRTRRLPRGRRALIVAVLRSALQRRREHAHQLVALGGERRRTRVLDRHGVEQLLVEREAANDVVEEAGGVAHLARRTARVRARHVRVREGARPPGRVTSSAPARVDSAVVGSWLRLSTICMYARNSGRR